MFSAGTIAGFLAWLLLGLLFPKWFRSRTAWLALAALPMGALAFSCGVALWQPVADHGDAITCKVAWLWLQGWPIYPPSDSPFLYAVPHGPLNTVLTALGFVVFGPHLISAAVIHQIACWGSVVVVALTCRKLVPTTTTFILTGLYCGLLFISPYPNANHWLHPEPFLILITACACWLVVTHKKGALFLVSALAGIAATAKPHGFLALVPLVVALLDFRSLRSWGVALAGFLLAFGGIYALPGASLRDQILVTRTLTAHGVTFELLLENLTWLLVMLLPLAAIGLTRESLRAIVATPRRRIVLLAATPAVILTLIAGAKPGSAAYHLLPFVPVTVIALAWGLNVTRRGNELSPVLFAAGCGMALLAVYQSARLGIIAEKEHRQLVEIRRDVAAFRHAFPDRTLAFGIGTEWTSYLLLTTLHAEEVFHQNFLVADFVTLMDRNGSHLPLPTATQNALLERYDVWILPANESPFGYLENTYEPKNPRPLFPAEFITAFREKFQLKEHSEKVDFWVKRTKL